MIHSRPSCIFISSVLPGRLAALNSLCPIQLGLLSPQLVADILEQIALLLAAIILGLLSYLIDCHDFKTTILFSFKAANFKTI
jgi:hypothetical protein